jgi:hypothetical protein
MKMLCIENRKLNQRAGYPVDDVLIIRFGKCHFLGDKTAKQSVTIVFMDGHASTVPLKNCEISFKEVLS